MLRRTGFVQVDTGVDVITAFAGKTDPAEVTLEDLDAIADYLERIYSEGPGQSLAAGIAFTNSGFSQPSWNNAQFRYKRQAYADLVLRGHRQTDLEPILEKLEKAEYREMVLRDKPNAPMCAFSGEPAYLRVSRDMLPMLNGRGVINFGGLGVAGLPVCDWVLLAIHAMPLGCLISQGRLLAVDSDDADLVFEFVKRNYEHNRLNLSAAASAGWRKLPNQSSFKTALINQLVDISHLPNGQERFERRPPSLTAYHFSNSGTDPKIDIYALPSPAVSFVATASSGKYQQSWGQIVFLAWQGDPTDDQKQLEDPEPKLTRRNFLYEDLFDLPDEARRFLRTYFLRQPMKWLKKDVRAAYSLRDEADLLSWDLTDLFLKRMMNVEKSRIDQIRKLGDRLAEYISTRGDKRLLNDLYNVRDYRSFRLILLRAVKNYSGDAPLLEFDAFVSIFEEAEDFARLDWNLARDLLLIRIFEQLHHHGQLEQLVSELPDTEPIEPTATSAA